MRVLFLLITLLITKPIAAQDVFSGILISDEIKQKQAQEQALEDAQLLSKKNLERLKLRQTDAKHIQPIKKRSSQSIKDNQAPFGLAWGYSVDEIKDLGVGLKKYQQVDYVNSYQATYLTRPIKGFDNVIISFGENNSLWRILAYSNPKKDDVNAQNILLEYEKFYKLLEQKYGNAKQVYNGVKETNIINGKAVEVEAKIGNANFLEQLKNNQATLYATFNNGIVGVALSVNVNANDESYLAMDYKNIKLFDNREKQTLDAL